ncbi:MAG: hypothetical protein JNL90_15295 [Planctomycetes bacterium]|nr:hypothetical protein [Planctomycetota bacterium]
MQMKTSLGALLAAVPLFIGTPALAQTVTITDLPLLPGGTYASAYGIDDTGKIVGVANDSTFTLQTVQWVNGQISVIPGLGGGLAVPEDVNDAGEIAGGEDLGKAGHLGIYWDAQNQPFQLPGLPGGASNGQWAHGINSFGQIAGMAQEGMPNSWGHAVVWLGTSLQTDLGFMGGGTYSEAFGINDLGEVVGVAAVANTNQHAFLWKSGQYTDLSTWSGGGASSKAYAINRHGVIVGMNANVASVFENGRITALTMPRGVSAFTPAVDINDNGDIIATGSKGYPIDVGVLWRNRTAINLGTLSGGTISRARRINACGEIVGEANTASGFFHAVKWTVTPAPTWTDLGHALPGSAGAPLLVGNGDLSANSTITVTLSGGLPNALMFTVLGIDSLYAPLFGGMLVPTPTVVFPAVQLDGSGGATLTDTMPPGISSGSVYYLQSWILDPAGPRGLTASNALKATTP